MFSKSAAATALAIAMVGMSAPAAADTYDAFTSFNATQGSGGFTYGGFNGTTFTPFTQNTGCVVSGVTCLRGAGSSLPSVFKSDGSQQSDGTVILPLDRLVVHPGEGDDSVYVAFTVTQAGNYTYSAAFNQQDSNTAQHSVGITEFFIPVGGTFQLFPPSTVVDQAQPEVLTGFSTFAAVGDVIGYIVDKNGSYFNDSTGLNFTLVSDVPEPASWAMMIVGFGMAGAATRRKAARRAIAA